MAAGQNHLGLRLETEIQRKNAATICFDQSQYRWFGLFESGDQRKFYFEFLRL